MFFVHNNYQRDQMTEIKIYEAENGQISVDVLVENETVWLSLNQLSELFERDKSVISRHLKSIFDSHELDSLSTVAKYATVQSEGGRNVERQIDFYNLDAIISVGYRVNSKRGTQFRQWANKLLKDYLIKGYALNQNKLLSRGISDLESSISLLSRTLDQQALLSDIGQEAVRIIHTYARSWKLLLQYDEGELAIPQSLNIEPKSLGYELCKSCILDLKEQLIIKNEAAEIFGIERSEYLKAILGNLDQTFDGQSLYPTVEERAAHFLYFVIKDHPFSDGNKRIGSFLFLLYLHLNNIKTEKINEVTLVALALLVAESRPSEKEFIIPLIVNLII